MMLIVVLFLTGPLGAVMGAVAGCLAITLFAMLDHPLHTQHEQLFQLVYIVMWALVGAVLLSLPRITDRFCKNEWPE
jgi:hypothetical protein